MSSNKDNFIIFLKRIYITAFLILCASLLYYQIIQGNYYLTRAKNNYVRVIPERSIRGKIFDRNGVTLAYDRPSFNIAVIPYQIKSNKEEIIDELAKFCSLKPKSLNRNYSRKFQNFFTPVDIISDISKKEAFRIEEKFVDSVLIDPQPQRYYVFPYETAHLLGYVKDAASFYERLKKYGYSPNERIGISGIEQYYDDYLRGTDGGDLIEVNSSGKIVGFLGKLNADRGKDIYVTIDSKMQQAAYQAISGKKGALIFMDSKNGEILALVSYPSFDPNSFVKGKDEVSNFLNDKNKPMQNRAIQSTFPLGSTFKPIVAAAGLQENKLKPSTTFICNGKLNIGKAEFECENVHNEENLYEAIAHSCNVYFYNVGILLGRQIMASYAEKFGLNSLSGIDLPYEKRGTIPVSSMKIKSRWYLGDTLNLSIGQGYTECSPIEIMLAINVFSNGGYLVKPHLIKKIENAEIDEPKSNKVDISSQNIIIVKTALAEVVGSEEGTSRMLKPLNLSIAGKTGTAQTSGRPHGWFAGFFPEEAPKYTICVFLENGGSSYEALKVTYSFLEKLKEQQLL
ncbi:MAG: penicillin-binding protein 2 [Candidatus Omnitrophica bacterium]|nr:penicillin-binding protein 2 [Candidatus Omnitrophota bacterium]